MNKFWKIFISIILALVVIAGVYVGIVTKGFRKWEKFKTDKVSGSVYKSLQDKYTDLENDNKWLRNKFMNVDYIVSSKDRYSAISVDGGNYSEICYAYNKVGNYGFLNSFRIKNIKKLFESKNSVFEVRFFELYNVDKRKDKSFLTEFSIEDEDKRITNDFINSVTFSIRYMEEITSEQKALIEAGTDEVTKFNVKYEFDLNLDDYTELYNVTVRMFVVSVRVVA